MVLIPFCLLSGWRRARLAYRVLLRSRVSFLRGFFLLPCLSLLGGIILGLLAAFSVLPSR